jgi:hypothetical protein
MDGLAEIATAGAMKLRDIHISGFGTGIKTRGPVDLDASRVTFDNVQRPWDIQGARSTKISGTRITNDPKLRGGSDGTRTSSGWHPGLGGPPLPVFCGNCKTIFPSRNHTFSGQYFELWDNEEPCPGCGFEHAKLSEGIFNLAEDTVEVLSAPDITHAMLAATQFISDKVIAGEIAGEDAVVEYEAVTPKIGEVAKRAWSFGKSAFWTFAAIASIASLYLALDQKWANTECQEATKQQVEIQQQSEVSRQRALEQVLEELSRLRFKLDGVYENPNGEGAKEAPTSPSEDEARTKPSPLKFAAQGRQKARERRRLANRQRRSDFGGARHH